MGNGQVLVAWLGESPMCVHPEEIYRLAVEDEGVSSACAILARSRVSGHEPYSLDRRSRVHRLAKEDDVEGLGLRVQGNRVQGW